MLRITEFSKKNKYDLGQLYSAYLYGDELTNDQVLYGIEKLKILCPLLMEMGERMHLSWKECNRFLYALEDFAKARGLKIKKSK